MSRGICQDYLSPNKLSEITGEKDLRNVTYLDLSVNSSESSLGNFGMKYSVVFSGPPLGGGGCTHSVDKFL